MPGAGEVDLLPLPAEVSVPLTWAWPRVVGRTLIFHTCGPDDLRPGTWEIPEPPERAPRVAPRSLDLLIVPGLAFDRQGGRLGQGGGFYDRLLAAERPPRVVAVAFFDQIRGAVPTEAHDQPVDAVVTERGWLHPIPAPGTIE